MPEVIINITNSKMQGPTQIGNHNQMNLNGHTNNLTEEQWNEIRRFLSERRNDFSYDTEEYKVICEAESLALKKEKRKFQELLAKKKDVFLNSVLSTVGAVSVKELIKWILSSV